jgi:hypothetical protein
MGWFADPMNYIMHALFSLVPTLRESCRPRQRQIAYVAEAAAIRPDRIMFMGIARTAEARARSNDAGLRPNV